jgi:phosphoglycolate phosphatase
MSKSSIERSKIRTVIFDLDGTLVDSAPAILEGLEYAIKKAGINSALPLTSSLVGPPLRDTLLKLIGDEDGINLDDLITDFKNYYDLEGFKKSKPYPGIEKLLMALRGSGIILYLATNKRLIPTQKIVKYFGWENIFNEIYTIDKFANFPFENKALMIQALLKEKAIDPSNGMYVGDREEDRLASTYNKLPSILVAWGYGDFQRIASREMIYPSTSEELQSIIMEKI